ncbi:hypothetical protein OC846_003489 [Tilletia horrida]|uniref:Calcofluor white hypersensitive protein n=1 Tax=Tilletia horrida TaxID=155126 RepID=A0AAN6JRP5_9BASI|nr:hypothetical protein OC846_003489 [Tilletia horrida]KAK0551318.1 hypothetical protein OC845_002228 [Tilletia horrida]KAK0567959.1 hypothetical protein OC861_002410 [Tilletia horrida]
MAAQGSSRTLTLIAGAAVAGGVGYYLYNSNGNVSAAKDAAKADAHRLEARITGDAKSLEKKGQATFESALSDAKVATRDLQSQLGSLSARTQKESEAVYTDIKNQAAAAADKVSAEADKAASKAKGWFK